MCSVTLIFGGDGGVVSVLIYDIQYFYFSEVSKVNLDSNFFKGNPKRITF